MAKPRVFFMNVSSMRDYQGYEGDITGHSGRVKEHGYGYEIFNFKPYQGRFYGYGHAANNSIALERLGARQGAPFIQGAHFIDDVLVVWVANSHVVGWYKNARVYRKAQPAPHGSERTFLGEESGYYFSAKRKGCKLLKKDARTLPVPRAWKVDGGMSRYVWYAEDQHHEPFLKELFDFIESDGRASARKLDGKKGGGRGWQVDPRRRKLIEEAAVRRVMQYYGNELGYQIDDRQHEHCGWDLEVTKNDIVLYLEVKGVAGDEIGVELTANEYKCMKKYRSIYKVCIVTNALSKTPTLSVYGYMAGSKQWEHHEDGSPIQIEPVWVQTARLHR